MPSKSERPKMTRRRKDMEDFISGASESQSSRHPPEGTVRINANIPRSLYKQLKIKSVQEERSMTNILADLIRRYVEG